MKTKHWEAGPLMEETGTLAGESFCQKPGGAMGQYIRSGPEGAQARVRQERFVFKDNLSVGCLYVSFDFR